MITRSIARTIDSPKGWLAEFHLAGESEPHRLTDTCGRPIVYLSEDKALIAAQAALLAAMERVDAVYIPPARTTACRPWQVYTPRSKAGRKALFQSIFREVEA